MTVRVSPLPVVLLYVSLANASVLANAHGIRMAELANAPDICINEHCTMRRT